LDKSVLEKSRIGKGVLFWVVVLGVLLRAISAWTAWSIRGDGCGYLEMARGFSDGDPSLFISKLQHPLFPALISWTHAFVGDWILSGWLVGLVAGAVAIVLAWFLCLEVAGRREALFGASLVAVHPLLIEGVGGILTESVYIAATLGAVYGIVWSCRQMRVRGVIFGGIAAGISYLTRPEGGMVGVLLVSYLLVRVWRTRSLLTGLGYAALFSSALMGVALPLIVTLSVANGYPTLSGKKFSSVFADWSWGPGYLVEEGTPSPVVQELATRYVAKIRDKNRSIPALPQRVEQDIQGLDETGYTRASHSKIEKRGDPFLEKLFKSWHPVFFILIGLGLFVPKRWSPRVHEESLFLTLFFGLLGVLAYVNHREGYVSSRHLVAVGILLVPWAARGLSVAGENWMLRSFGRWSRTSALPQQSHRALGLALFVSISLLVLAGKAVKKQGRSGWVSRQCGEKIAATVQPDDRIMTSDGRASFYAGGQFLRVPVWGGYAKLIEILIDQSVDYLILAPGDQFKVRELIDMGWLREIQSTPDRKKNLWRTYTVELKDP
jgi:hypothetical protein